MVTLSSRQRALLLFLSASAYVAWFAGLGDRIEAQDIGSARASVVTIDARPSLPNVASIIARDPFAGKPEPQAAAPHRLQLAMASVPAPEQDVVVPDIDARSAPAVASATLLLRATIVGPEPVAYVANGSAMDIVRVGDTLGDRRITKIELRGIVFSDGTRLDLPESYVPTPAPKRPTAQNGELTLRALRQLLSAREASNGPAADGEARATPQASTSYPTPGPLPTVDARGLPVGVNPTDNPNGATPYPDPYPYAPRGPH